jgi:hypothetical protein
MGPESRNGGADEGRHQFTTTDELEPTVVSQKNMAMGLDEVRNQNRLGEGQQKITRPEKDRLVPMAGEEVSFENMQMVLERTKIWSWVTTVPEKE